MKKHMECECPYYDEHCRLLICSKKLKDEKIIKRRMRYGESESLFNIERGS